MTVIVADAPLARLPRLQVTTCPGGARRSPTDGTTLVAVTPSDSVSVTTTLTAVFGPALVTVMVDVTSAPATAGSGVVDLVTARLAFSATGVAVSLPTYVNGSPIVWAT